MHNMKKTLVVLLALASANVIESYGQVKADNLSSDSAAQVASFDSVAVAERYKARFDSLSLAFAKELGVSLDEVEDNPLYFRLFMPLTLYNEAISGTGMEDTDSLGLLPIKETAYQRDRSVSEQINQTLAEVYLNHPELIKTIQNDLDSIKGPVNDAIKNSPVEKIQLVNDLGPIKDAVAPEMVAEKPCFWKYPGSSAVKYTQSRYSDNWYKGGENNYSILVQLNQEANYARNSLTFDNKLEAKLGYYTTEKDGTTQFKTNEDLLRLTNKLGFKAFKYWYYTVQLQSYTQFMDVKNNDGSLKSQFFAPAYSNLSIGMDWKPKFKKKDCSLSLQLSPLSYNCRYVNDVSLATNFGIDEGENFKYSIGSRMEANWKLPILKMLKWTGKLQYYTSYKNVEANWENTLDMSINKYFAIQFFMHWRFDDSVNLSKKDPDLGYHQFKEFLTLNFTYTW